jgi:hypothetical protein
VVDTLLTQIEAAIDVEGGKVKLEVQISWLRGRSS